MRDALVVGIGQRIEHFPQDGNRFGDGQASVAGEPLPETLAVDVRHDVVQHRRIAFVGRGDRTRIDQRQDVRMLELCRDPDLAQEPLGADRGGELGLEHLDGDRPVVLEIVGQIDGGHPARPSSRSMR